MESSKQLMEELAEIDFLPKSKIENNVLPHLFSTSIFLNMKCLKKEPAYVVGEKGILYYFQERV